MEHGRQIAEGIRFSERVAVDDNYNERTIKDILNNYVKNHSTIETLQWVLSYGINRVDEMIPTVTSFFSVDVIPKENPIYYFDVNNEENDIPINSTGDLVTAFYKFVSKLWIEREDVFDEEEANV